MNPLYGTTEIPPPEVPEAVIPADPARRRREHFIPLRKAELVRLLAEQDELAESERPALRQLCRIVESMFHYEYHERLEKLKDCYAAFNPDADTRSLGDQGSGAAPKAVADQFFAQFRELVTRANYDQLSEQEIETAVGAASHWGVRLDIDFKIFRRLEVYARGDIVGKRTIRRLANWYRVEEIDVPIYQKLIVVFQLNEHSRLDKRRVDTEMIYLKLFKNIPKEDVDMLLPGTAVKMTWLDQGKILFPTISGISLTVAKIVKTGFILALTGTYGLLAFLGLVGGTIGYGVKSFLGYLRTKDKYQLNLTRSLYYQNLDNNAGVVFRLLDEAEEQEFREAVLAYYLLWKRAGAGAWSLDQIDRQAEQFLKQAADVEVDFEIHDAIDKLSRLGLVKSAGESWRAVPITEALRGLDCVWDALFEMSDE